MKRFTTFFGYLKFGSGGLKSILTLITFLFYANLTFAQFQERVYATVSNEEDIDRTNLGGTSVNSPGLAVDGDIRTASTLTVGLGAANLFWAQQNVRFGSTVPGTTPVTLKLGSGGDFLDLLGGTIIQATLNGSPVGPSYTGAALLGLLGGGVLTGGANVYEATFTPGTNYNGVRVRVSSVLGLGITANFYHAYYLRSTTTPNCNTPVDALYGVGASTLSLASGVSNPYNVLTGATPPTQLNTGVTATGNVSETVVFPGARVGNAQLVISRAGSPLVNTSVLSNIRIIVSDRGTERSNTTLNSLLLSLNLLSSFNDPTAQQVTLTIPQTLTWDRVTILTGGAVNALTGLNIHRVTRLLPAPTVTSTNVSIYAGQTATLTATSVNSSDILTWFNSDNVEIGTGTSINVTPSITSSYTVVARSGASCNDNSAAATATVTVFPLPTFTNPTSVVVGTNYIGNTKRIIVSGGQGTNSYTFSNGSGLPAGLTLNSDGSITGTPTGTYATGANTVNFTANVTDATLNIPVVTARQFSIVVYPALAANTALLPDSYVGATAYPANIPVPAGGSGETANYVYSLASGTVPAGLTLNSNGTFTGSPSTAGSYSFSITVTDPASGATVAQPYTVVISPQLLLPGGTFPTAFANQTLYNQPISAAVIENVSTNGSATGGKAGATLVYSLAPPNGRILAFPSGFNMDQNGTLSGNPSITGISTNTFTVYVTDGEQVASNDYTLVIESALPVKLTSFKVAKEGEIAQLSWSTTSESNSERFEVQRSRDGKEWNAIGSRDAKGESAAIVTYNFTDPTPFDGENLYRLKMIDRDATFAFSGIQSARFAFESLKLYPNPIASTEPLNIQVKDWGKVKSVRVFNALGKVVFESAGDVKSVLSTEQLAAGLYIVQVMRTDGQTISSKFVKR